ncbi:MAG: hypothetical protein IPK81_01020 [Rhodospirillales bacterium]|nr:MAG: hypothetical protein IPK81_01020 [Rhodospirillales bacterium]
MSRPGVLAAAGFALGLAALGPQLAAAQCTMLRSDEAACCLKLKGLHERYLPNRSMTDSRGGGDGTETMVAPAWCDGACSAEAIPHIEKMRCGHGFALPEPAIGARLDEPAAEHASHEGVAGRAGVPAGVECRRVARRSRAARPSFRERRCPSLVHNPSAAISA